MINYLVLLVALILSGVAAYYSIIGLTAIFAAAFIPILIMGGTLELAKVVATSWLYRNWKTCPFVIKAYLTCAIITLMLITSMGTYGYLSKAHTDQSMVSGDAIAKLEIIDEKIRTSKTNIEVSRKALKQLDDAVDQIMARSQSEKSVNSAIYIRRTQQKERQRLMADIEAEQKRVSALNEERIPLATQVRKVEAEVGPIKFIAALFSDNNSQESLEGAVRWVIILIVSVFDPLAVVLLLAANHGLAFRNEEYIPDDRSWIQRVKDLKNKRDPSKIEVSEDSILKL